MLTRTSVVLALLPGCLISGKEGLGDDDGPGPGPGFQCADDGFFEPNDEPFQASSASTDATFGPNSICPEFDVDHYQFFLSETASIEMIVAWGNGAEVEIDLLDSGGFLIQSSSPFTATSSRNCISFLSPGNYIARASVISFDRQNYTTTISTLQVGCDGEVPPP